MIFCGTNEVSVNFQKLKSYQTTFQPQSYEIDNQLPGERNKAVKNTNARKLNNMLLNNKDITEESKRKSKKYLETKDNEISMTQNL